MVVETSDTAQAVHAKLLDAVSLAICGVLNDEEHDCGGGWVSTLSPSQSYQGEF